ncbi:MAG: cytochrome P450 [Stappiaceae bacterium]
MTSLADLGFDPLSTAFSTDPYPVYRALREQEEILYFEEQDMWLLSRYDDVSAVATDPTMVRSLVGISPAEELAKRQRLNNWHDMPYHERFVQFSLLDSDGEVHRRLRKQVFGAFTGRSVETLEPMVQTFVDGLIDELADRSEFDFIEDFAAHIPGYVIGKFLGAPTEDCRQLRRWSEQVVRFFDVDRNDEKKVIAETATREFYQYLVDLKVEREKRPKDDLISTMLEQQRAGQYSDDEFISTCMLILMAGHGSTIDVLGSGMHTLLKNPDAMKRLRNQPEMLPDAIQEMFRFESPLPFFHRHATQDTDVGGNRYPAGTTFGLLYGAANRDPSHFDDPDTFRIDRQPNRHLAFGRGPHLCLGNHLARLNMKIIFSTLLRRFNEIELAEDAVVYKRGLSVRGPKRLSVGWRAA